MVNTTPRIRGRLLCRLRAATEPLSGEELAADFGLSRVAIWKHLEALRRAGYALEAERSGYRLGAEGDFLHPWEFPGREERILRFERTDSTMDRALELALRDPGSAAIVVAESQSAGRGRRGRAWQSPEGGLFASLVLAPGLAPWQAARAVTAAAIALATVLRELTGEAFAPEWPNDVCLEGRKVGGLLAEYLVEGEALRFLLLGLGVNVANAAPGREAMSLAELPAPRPTRRVLLAAFLDRFEALDLGRDPLAPAWSALSPDRGRPVLSRSDESHLGSALGIDEAGSLLVETGGGGVEAFRSGEARIADKERT